MTQQQELVPSAPTEHAARKRWKPKEAVVLARKAHYSPPCASDVARCQVEEVSVDFAAFYLSEERNTHNRNLRYVHVDRLAADITAERWRVDGQTIKISRTGKLLDGQHRLRAVVAAGRPIRSWVMRGLPDEAFHTIDANMAPRGPADVLHLEGEVSTTQLAATVALWQRLREVDNPNRWSRPISTSEVTALVVALKPGIVLSVRYAVAKSKRCGAPASVVAVAHYEFAMRDPLLAATFLEALATGVNLNDTDPVYHLRRVLLQNAAAKAKLTQKDILAYVIKAWNATRAGKRIKLLTLRAKGGMAEEFPVIR